VTEIMCSRCGRVPAGVTHTCPPPLYKTVQDVAHVVREQVEQETAEAIARWLETRSSSFPGQQRLTAAAIRRGAWGAR
jgi:hypothetical protein